MGNARKQRHYSILAAVGIALGVTYSAPGCIFHEADNITFPDPGHKWCATLFQAHAWGSNPAATQDIVDNGDWPTACVCFSEGDNTLLEGWEATPPSQGDAGYSEFVLMTDLVRTAAIDRCIEMRESIWPNLPNEDCAVVADTATIFQSNAMGESDCTLFTPAGDTDSYDTDAPSSITCPRPHSCDIDQAFWDEIAADPLGLNRDKTHGIFSSSGTTLRDVYSGSIAYELNLRTGDLITAVDGMPVTDFDEVEAAIQALQDQSGWTVTVERDGRTLTFVYNIV